MRKSALIGRLKDYGQKPTAGIRPNHDDTLRAQPQMAIFVTEVLRFLAKVLCRTFPYLISLSVEKAMLPEMRVRSVVASQPTVRNLRH